MEIELGATVVSQDGEDLGTIDLLIVDPRSNVLSHVVLAATTPARQRRALPIWAIDRCEAKDVYLKVEADAIARFPQFRFRRRAGESTHPQPPEALPHEPGEFPSLFPEDGSLPPIAVALAKGTAITCRQEEAAGRLVGLEADDYTAEVTTLFVQLHGPGAKRVAVPTVWARALGRHRIILACSASDLQGLPSTQSEPVEGS